MTDGEDFREDMAMELEDMHDRLVRWKEEHGKDLHAAETDLLYDAMLSVTDLMDALNETLYMEDAGGVEQP